MVGYRVVTEQLPPQSRTGIVSSSGLCTDTHPPTRPPQPNTSRLACLAFLMTQTTWHASGATDAPPQVSGGNTEASVAQANTPLHPSTNPDLGKAAPKIDPPHRGWSDSSSDGPRLRPSELEKLEGLLSSFQGSPNEAIAYRELAEWLRKHPQSRADALPSYWGEGKRSVSPEAPGPSAILELQTAVDAGSKRIELRASQQFVDTLDSLAQETNLSRANVIRRAIALYARALWEKSRGNVIGIAALENNQIRLNEIIQV